MRIFYIYKLRRVLSYFILAGGEIDAGVDGRGRLEASKQTNQKKRGVVDTALASVRDFCAHEKKRHESGYQDGRWAHHFGVE